MEKQTLPVEVRKKLPFFSRDNPYQQILDQAGNRWVVGNFGIYIIEANGNLDHPVKNQIIDGLSETDEGQVLLPIIGEGLRVYQPHLKPFKQFLDSRSALGLDNPTDDHPVITIRTLNDSTFFYASLDLFGKISFTDKSLSSIQENQIIRREGIYGANILVVNMTEVGEDWLLSTTGGIALFDPKQNRIKRTYPATGLDRNHNLSLFTQAYRPDSILVNYTNGLYFLDPIKWEMKPWIKFKNPKSKLYGTVIHPNGTVYMICWSGIYRWKPGDDLLISEEDAVPGLLGKLGQDILIDKFGKVWVSTSNDGVFSIEGDSVRQFFQNMPF
ncbi:MAG: hypothetical protein AAFV80_24490, partial [Bacteroidota bacterium]